MRFPWRRRPPPVDPRAVAAGTWAADLLAVARERRRLLAIANDPTECEEAVAEANAALDRMEGAGNSLLAEIQPEKSSALNLGS